MRQGKDTDLMEYVSSYKIYTSHSKINNSSIINAKEIYLKVFKLQFLQDFFSDHLFIITAMNKNDDTELKIRKAGSNAQ